MFGGQTPSSAGSCHGLLIDKSLHRTLHSQYHVKFHILIFSFRFKRRTPFFLCFPNFFPIKARRIPPVWPVPSPSTRGQRRLRWPEPGPGSAHYQEPEMWPCHSQSSLSGGHGVNIIPESSNIHQAIWCGQHWIIFFVFEFLSTFKNMSDSELFPELGALQWFSIRRHVNNEAAAEVSEGGAANVLLNSYVMKFD